MKTPDPTEFRHALSRFTTGVTVLTAAEADGTVAGMTANSFTSVSLAPPTILVSVMQGRTLKAIEAAGMFVVNVLGAGAERISGHFAGKPVPAWTPDFAAIGEYVGLDGALANFACRVQRRVEVNDHVLLIAEVEHCHACEADPLVFYGSRYRRLAA